MNALLVLGSNIEPALNLPRALDRLSSVGSVRSVSRAYRSAPAGGAPGPPFWNAAVALDTALHRPALHDRLRTIEAALGRTRTGRRDAPRTIDIDIVAYAEEAFDPAASCFAHIAVPLADIVPEHRLANGETVAAAARRLAEATPIRAVATLGSAPEE